MRIESLHFKNITEGWELSETKFDDLNLLVGVSGAGKTQILEAILTIRGIALGQKIHQKLEWKIVFSSAGGTKTWTCRTGIIEKNYEPLGIVVAERLVTESEVLLERDSENTFFEGNRIPHLRNDASLLYLLASEPLIDLARSGFDAIFISAINDREPELPFFQSEQIERIKKALHHPSEVTDELLDVKWKMYFMQEIQAPEFQFIREDFIETFPQIKAIRSVLVHHALPDGDGFLPELQIQVAGLETWIEERKISSGMRKTLLTLAEIHLSPGGMVLLVDEFENSLGVNCLSVVTQQIKRRIFENRIQFIITSHHPYIINNIDMKNWKVVTRKGGVIRTLSAEDLKLGRSKHQAFFQLINSDAYLNGVAA